jgi:KaiC/GvpD/RAD55 family RecA-like ATPase
MDGKHDNTSHLIQIGVAGLDEVLGGGLAPNRLYLIEGDPVSGKTTLSLQILLQGVRRGERCMYVTLSETADVLRSGAKSHGWTLEGIDMTEIVESVETAKPDAREKVTEATIGLYVACVGRDLLRWIRSNSEGATECSL